MGFWLLKFLIMEYVFKIFFKNCVWLKLNVIMIILMVDRVGMKK